MQHGSAEFEHRIATVAFLRFSGVDGVLASRGPDDVAEALERLVSTVQEAAEAESVTFLASDIDEDGGKLILVSGVPRAQTDDEGRMLRTVRALADADLALPVQIGVNHGHVFAGPLGASRPRHLHGDGRHREPGRPADGGGADGRGLRHPRRPRSLPSRVRCDAD